MKIEITEKELQLILESLTYSKLKFEEYSQYPSDEFKTERIKSVEELIKSLKQQSKTQ